MKKIYLTIAAVLCFLGITNLPQAKAQAISTHFFGENAWMPDTLGTTVYYGQLHNNWKNIQNSHASIIRFGGIGPDQHMPTNFQYIRMIDSVRAKGMEPIIQVPFNNYMYSPAQAAAIVTYINVTKAKNIKYWIISNEPNLSFGFNASQIAAYIKPFATAMKAADPNILTIGPEIAWFDYTTVTDLTTPGGPSDITGADASGRYYIDYFSYHAYPFDGTQTRAQALTNLTTPWMMQDNLTYLQTRLNACNSHYNRTGIHAIKKAITEANIGWQSPATDNLYGLGANSFLGGQFITEMFGIGMKNSVDFINIWSVVEGNNIATNNGYIDPVTHNKKPEYYHFQMLADNFSGNYANGTTNVANVKSFGSKNATQESVIIMNEDLTNNYNYTVRLNTAAVSGTNALKINIDAGIAVEYNDIIPNQTSVLLVFNSAGAITKKIVYSIASHAALNLPPTTILYGASAPVANFSGTPTAVSVGSTVSFSDNSTNSPTSRVWTFTGGSPSTSTTANPVITYNTAGTYAVSLTATNSAGNNTKTIAGYITVTNSTVSIPATPGTISGITSGLCPSGIASANYSIQPVQGATSYTWTVPTGVAIASGQGTTSVHLNFSSTFTSGYLSVTAHNTSGTSSARTLALKSILTAPIAISGQATNLCGITTMTYSIPVVTGASSYTWIIPSYTSILSGQGTTSIVLTFQTNFSFGNLSVKANNGCGSSSVRILTLKRGTPTPATLSGLADVCGITSTTYSTTPVAGATSYNWTVPAGMTITAGQGTTSINVNIATTVTSGYVRVSGVNGCGSGTAKSLTVTGCLNKMLDTTHVDTTHSATSIENNVINNSKLELNVFPNPTVGKFTVKMNDEADAGKDFRVSVLNTVGQVVYETKSNFAKGSEEILLEENIVSGIYFVKVEDGTNSVTEKIVLER